MNSARLPRTAVLLAGLLVAGCGADVAVPANPVVSAVKPMPPGAAPVTGMAPPDNSCDAEASLRPGPNSATIAPGSPIDRIRAKGRLTVGVDQNTYLFGFRDPASGQLHGFDIDLARELAFALLGDRDKIEFRSVATADRVRVLQQGQVDLVVRTFSTTCDRRRDVDFSSVYYRAAQRILAPRGSGISKAEDLGGKRVCVTFGADSAAPLLALPKPASVLGVENWTDCLVALQQGQVDAISTDESILAGLAAQDDNLQLVGAPMGFENYAVGVPKGQSDMVRFVNGVLERIRTDGTWQRLYDANLTALGPAPAPPAARYSD
ncbi:glutamate ABC transporter substrate-binding protein [Nocardia terpenica]|nr:glutamate ABC transporter substrate-binding protein [Nocardia terpenica]